MNTKEVAQRFVAGYPCASGNHTVTSLPDGTMLYLLHGHCIARWLSGEWFELRHAGYATPTTAKALNAVLAACNWLPFKLKAWCLTDTRTGKSYPFPSNGDPLRLLRVVQAGKPDWIFEQEHNGHNPRDLAPTIGG